MVDLLLLMVYLNYYIITCSWSFYCWLAFKLISSEKKPCFTIVKYFFCKFKVSWKSIGKLFCPISQGFECVKSALNYSKDFDSVNFDLLLAKVRFYRFDDVSIGLFSSYLLEGPKKQKGNEQFSSDLRRCIGVPQGRCLERVAYFSFSILQI